MEKPEISITAEGENARPKRVVDSIVLGVLEVDVVVAMMKSLRGIKGK